MSEHPINSIMDTSLKKIKELIDVNSIIGDPITAPDGTTIIPISKVTYGFASGGSDLPSKSQSGCFVGGSGAGVTISPAAFIVVKGTDVRLLQINPHPDAADKAISMVPELIDRISELFKKDKEISE